MSQSTPVSQENYDEFLADLSDWLRIPSVSADPSRRHEVARAARFTAALFENAGLQNVSVIDDPEGGHPLVYGDSFANAQAPTLLCYGHYDVQPEEPAELWNTPPFEPTQLGENLYARGAADDKGLALILIKAAARFHRRGETPPINLKFLYEGEEESGGNHIARYLAANADALRAQAVLLCDTEMFAPGLPTLTTGLRGILYGELHIRTAAGDLHSGVYGGGAPNAIFEAAKLVAALKDDEGRIAIPELHAAVQRPSDAELASWDTLPFDEEAWRREDAKVFVLRGESEYGLLERLWARPTLEIHGIRGGFTGEGAKTVIPAEALVKFSLRLVPGLTPEIAKRALQNKLTDLSPAGVQVSLRILNEAEATLIDPAHPLIQSCARVMSQVFGRETVFMRSGGSIPIVGLFQDKLGIPSVMPGFGLPDDNLHAPNEKVYLPNIARGIDAMEAYFRSLGDPD
jgi:acetylornithine deacetylase/succinyl-diaminopimelate desuccinylase-like protein